MTATTVFDHHVDVCVARRPRPQGLDRAVIRISMAMLVWARRRADRAVVSHEDQILMLEARRAVERMEYDNARITARLY